MERKGAVDHTGFEAEPGDLANNVTCLKQERTCCLGSGLFPSASPPAPVLPSVSIKILVLLFPF